jgi:signal peptidase I
LLKKMSTLRVIVQPIAIAVALGLIVRASAVGLYSIPSPSMAPTLQVGDTILVTPYLSGARPSPGDVVVFHSPAANGEMIVKRVVAVPGDLIEAREGRVAIGGHTLAEPYAIGTTGSLAAQIVPPDSYYVLGDNRPDSYDSRLWGAISARAIIGRARLVLWSGVRAPRANATSMTGAPGARAQGVRLFRVIR